MDHFHLTFGDEEHLEVPAIQSYYTTQSTAMLQSNPSQDIYCCK